MDTNRFSALSGDVTSSQTGPQIPPCLLPTNTQTFDKGNIYTLGEIFDDFERDRSNHQMNWITWAIGAGNAALLEMFQHWASGEYRL
jgi:hypothetical protein